MRCVRAGVEVRCAPRARRPSHPACGSSDECCRHARRQRRRVPRGDSTSSAPATCSSSTTAGASTRRCVGDLMALEATGAGLGGHRHLGSAPRHRRDRARSAFRCSASARIPTGPAERRARGPTALSTAATVGEWTVTHDDSSFADEDGVLFVPADRADELLAIAEGIRDTERRPGRPHPRGHVAARAGAVRTTTSPRARPIPALTFREHLRTVGGEIEV